MNDVTLAEIWRMIEEHPEVLLINSYAVTLREMIRKHGPPMQLALALVGAELAAG